MSYELINWKNGPTGRTKLNAGNLNHMDGQIKANADEIEDLKTRPTGGASLILTGQRRLTTSEAGKIAGLDVKGKSSQEISNNIANPANIKKGWFSTSSKTIDGAYGTIAICRVKPNTSYTYSKIAGDRTVLGLGNYDGDISEVGVGFTLDTVVSQRTVNTGSHNVLVVYANSEWSQAVADVIMVNEGSAEIPFEPYTGQPTPDHEIPIVNASGVIQAIGKNLFSGLNITSGKYIGDDGTIGNDNPSGYTDLISVEANTAYTFSAKSGGGGRKRLHAYDANGKWIKLIGSVVAPARGNAVTLTGTTPDNAKFIRLSYSYNPSYEGGANNDTEVQIEAGATATAYEPYQSNQIDLSAYDLRSAGSIADELIVYPDKTGKLIKWTGEADLGELDYTYTASWGGHHAFTTEMQGIIMPVNSNNEYGNIMSAKFSVSTRNIMASTSAEGLMCLNTYGSVIFATDTVSSVEAFKAAMSGTKLFYALATPIETPLTADQVAEILALETYAPETIIETELDLQSVDYLGDVKGYIDSKNEYSYTIRKIGKWADGKDFFQIIIKTTTPPAGTDGMVSNIITTNNASVKRMSGMVTSGNACSPISDYYNTATYNSIWIDGGGIKIHSSTSDYYANRPCEIIVEYTYKDGAAPAAASVMALTDDATQTTGDEIILPEPETYIDDTVVYGGN